MHGISPFQKEKKTFRAISFSGSKEDLVEEAEWSYIALKKKNAVFMFFLNFICRKEAEGVVGILQVGVGSSFPGCAAMV